MCKRLIYCYLIAEIPTAMQLDLSTKRWLQIRLKNGIPTRYLLAFPRERSHPTAWLRLRTAHLKANRHQMLRGKYTGRYSPNLDSHCLAQRLLHQGGARREKLNRPSFDHHRFFLIFSVSPLREILMQWMWRQQTSLRRFPGGENIQIERRSRLDISCYSFAIFRSR